MGTVPQEWQEANHLSSHRGLLRQRWQEVETRRELGTAHGHEMQAPEVLSSPLGQATTQDSVLQCIVKVTGLRRFLSIQAAIFNVEEAHAR